MEEMTNVKKTFSLKANVRDHMECLGRNMNMDLKKRYGGV